MKKMKRWIAALLAAVMLCAPAMETVAANDYPDNDMFAAATSIKGKQGAEDENEYGGLQHSLINIFLDQAIYSPESETVQNGGIEPYEFEGEKFYFNANPSGMGFVKNSNKNDMSISVVFLLRWVDNDTNNTEFLIDEDSRREGYNYYAPNTDLSTYGGRAFRAYWHFLMEWLCEKGYHLDNFILGNEVNMPNSWHYSGNSSDEEVVEKYADAFYTMYSTVRKYTDVSRCSVSLDHSWNHDDEGRGIAVRDYLNMFDEKLKEHEDNVEWCVSTHLYPALLFDTEIWDHPMGLTNNTVDTQMVDGTNLSVMTNYIRENFGEEHRVMLTEQGFSDDEGEAAQAACLAYTYYAAMYDPMVDCFLISVENAGEVEFDGETRSMDFRIEGTLAEEVYTKIGNGVKSDEEWIAETCLPVIGVDSWEEIVPNYGVGGPESDEVESGVLVDENVYTYECDGYSISYQVWSHGMVITDCSSSAKGEIEIPEKINGVKVVEIGRKAFKDCSGLTGELIIPSTVVKIGDYAFQGCRGLTGDLIIPSNVKEIGRSAFYECTGMTGDLTISPGIKEIAAFTFSRAGFKGTVTIPSTVTKLDDGAFYECPDLGEHLAIPSSVKKINAYAFYDCGNLTSITIPASVASIDSAAFEKSGLTTIYGEASSYAESYAKKIGVEFVAGEYVEKPKEYIGNVNSELLKFTYDEETKYISGEIVVVEWVDGVSTVPSVKPIMTFDAVDGSESIDVFVTATGTNTYYFDRLLGEGLTPGKEYIFNVTSGNELNVGDYTTVPIYTGTSSIGEEGVLGTVGNQEVCYKTDDATGYLLVYGRRGSYEGNVNSVLTEVECVTADNGDNFVSGNIVIVEWIDGESCVPETTPKMTFESYDGTECLDVFMACLDGTNTYYFDRNLTEDMDVTKDYIFRITLTDERNTSDKKSMVATTNYMDEKEGMLWETDTQKVMYKTVAADGDNQLRIYAVNK